MSLIFDRRAELGKKPVTHACLTGVSVYPHLPGGGGPAAPQAFGMESLASPALTAFRLAEWLIENKDRLAAPLATCRVLASPSAEELKKQKALTGGESFPTWKNFSDDLKAWRSDARSNPGNYTFFYFGGHGVKLTTGDSVLLLSDFGDGIGGSLYRGARLHTIHSGMAPSKKKRVIASTQFYFIDACRVLPDDFKEKEIQQVPDVMDVDLGGTDNRSTPIFYGSISGKKAYAVDGAPTVFGEALLSCLAGGAGDMITDSGKEEYVITNFSLAQSLPKIIADINSRLETDQLCTTDGPQQLASLVSLDAPPIVNITLEVDPAEAVPWTSVEIFDASTNEKVVDLPKPLNPHPISFPLPLRCYRLTGKVEPPQSTFANSPPLTKPARPPRENWKVLMRQ